MRNNIDQQKDILYNSQDAAAGDFKRGACQAIVDHIKNKENYFKSENIETGKTPSFLIYCSKGNDRETLNLYFDYKTSKKFINRSIFSVGNWIDFNSKQIKNLELLAVESLRFLGIEAARVKDTYQSDGI